MVLISFMGGSYLRDTKGSTYLKGSPKIQIKNLPLTVIVLALAEGVCSWEGLLSTKFTS